MSPGFKTRDEPDGLDRNRPFQRNYKENGDSKNKLTTVRKTESHFAFFFRCPIGDRQDPDRKNLPEPRIVLFFYLRALQHCNSATTVVNVGTNSLFLLMWECSVDSTIAAHFKG